MPYDRQTLELMLSKIPAGRVTRHGLLAAAMNTTPRAVARAVCLCFSNKPGSKRVVLKGGWLPHQDNLEVREARARILESEGIPISEDRCRVLVAEEDMWRP